MSDKKTDKPKKVLFAGLFAKLKAVKHIEVFISIIFIAIILLIYFSSGTSNSFDTNVETNKDSILPSALEYTEELEERVKKVLSKIKGAGEVSVMINCESGYEVKIAYTTETVKKTENSQPIETTTTTPVLITNNGETSPVILEYVSPKIKTVIIVATGAENTNVKLELIRAVEALLNVSTSAIQVFTGN